MYRSIDECQWESSMSEAKQVGCCGQILGDELSETDAIELATALKALADPARLRLLSLIAGSSTGEVCACDLVAPLGRSQPTVSHHLKVLREAGLIEGEKRGTWVWYRPVPAALDDLRMTLATEVAPRA